MPYFPHIITISHTGRTNKRNEVEKKEEVQNSNLLNALKHLIINLMNNAGTGQQLVRILKATSLIYQFVPAIFSDMQICCFMKNSHGYLSAMQLSEKNNSRKLNKV